MFEKLQSSIQNILPILPRLKAHTGLPGLGNGMNLTNELVFQLFTALTRQLHTDQCMNVNTWMLKCPSLLEAMINKSKAS